MTPIRCPFADWRPLPEATSQPPITPRVVIFHTAVGGLVGTERFFRESTGVESHLMVGGPWDGPGLDGVIWQWMDLGRQADANLDANSFAISVETSDNAPRSPELIEPWSPKQLTTLIRFGNWAADRFNIPRRICPRWDAAGFGWHAMWGAPSHWTPAVGKVCPGPARIAQLKAIVFPAIFAGTNPPEEDMPLNADDKQFIIQTRDEGVRMTAMGDPDGPSDRHVNNLAQIHAKLDALTAAVAALTPPEPQP